MDEFDDYINSDTNPETSYTFDYGLAEWGINLILPLFFMRSMTCRVVPSVRFKNSGWNDDIVFIPDNLPGVPYAPR